MSVLIKEIDGMLRAMDGIYSAVEHDTTYHTFSDENSYFVQIPMVGILKENLTVDVKDNVLSIVAKSNSKSIFAKNYKRSFVLEKDANLDEISAKLENGLLTVTVAKLKATKRTVNVQIV